MKINSAIINPKENIEKKILGNNFLHHILSIRQITREHIETFFKEASVMAASSTAELAEILHGKIFGIMFFQPSTRTRLSFEIAIQKLGGKVAGFSDIKTTRSGDFFQEPIRDVIQVIGQIADCLVIRHFQDFEAWEVSRSPVPLINAGDGGNEHPTQALCDLWSINNALGTIDGTKIGFLGDTECRVIRSTIIGLSKFYIKELLFLLPPDKNISDDTLSFLNQNNISWRLLSTTEDLLKLADVVIMIPFYLGDFTSSVTAGSHVKNRLVDDKYRLTKAKLIKVGRNIPIFHCGPRGDEIDYDLDNLSQVMYFKQIREALFMRMALLKKLIK